MRISDWSSDVCSSDLQAIQRQRAHHPRCERADDAGHVAAAPVRAAEPVAKLGGVATLVLPRPHADAAARLAVDLDGEHGRVQVDHVHRSEEHTSELQSLMRISYAVFCLKKKKK